MFTVVIALAFSLSEFPPLPLALFVVRLAGHNLFAAES